MKSLKDSLKKPVVIGCIVGSLLAGGGAFLVLRNIGLKNQNIYLLEQNDNMSNLYSNLISRYNALNKKKVLDSLDISKKHSLEMQALKKENLNLAYKLDRLGKKYLESQRKTLERESERGNFLEILGFVISERDFYKSYACYLDSLFQKELNKNKGIEKQPFN